jgi:putative ABC transport system permease protein
MNLTESLGMAAKTLVGNKLRSGLTMLGIIIGNASVIAMIGIGEGTQKLASDQFTSLGPNTLFILPGSPKAQNIRSGGVPPTLVLSDARAIARQVPSVVGVSPFLQASLVVTYRNVTTTSAVTGTNSEFLKVRSFSVAKGRFIMEADLKNDRQIAVLGPDLADRLFGGIDPIGQQIRVNNVSFEVVGLMAGKGSSFGSNQDDAVYVPITTMSRRTIGRTSPFGLRLSGISVSAKDSQSLDAAEFQITNLLRRRHKIIGDDDFTVRNQKDILQIVNTITGALTLLLAGIAAISLIVGGIGVMNIMLVSVTERTQEIGLRKAIGASERDILWQFTIEAIILSIAGGLVGTVIGIGSTIAIATFSPLQATVSVPAILMAVGVSGGIGLFFGVFPARQAARLDPIEALRSI